jgi:hypothetical protein
MYRWKLGYLQMFSVINSASMFYMYVLVPLHCIYANEWLGKFLKVELLGWRIQTVAIVLFSAKVALLDNEPIHHRMIHVCKEQFLYLQQCCVIKFWKFSKLIGKIYLNIVFSYLSLIMRDIFLCVQEYFPAHIL